jgi:hypothetical protein
MASALQMPVDAGADGRATLVIYGKAATYRASPAALGKTRPSAFIDSSLRAKDAVPAVGRLFGGGWREGATRHGAQLLCCGQFIALYKFVKLCILIFNYPSRADLGCAFFFPFLGLPRASTLAKVTVFA